MSDIDDIVSPDRLHIIGSDSGAGAIKFYASKVRQKPLQSILIGIGLKPSFGPLETLTSPRKRAAWARSQPYGLFEILWPEDPDGTKTIKFIHDFWDKVWDWNGAVTVWHSSRNAEDASFLLALANSIDRILEFDFVDVSMLPSEELRFVSTGECRPQDIEAALNFAYRLKRENIQAFSAKYKTLSAETSVCREFRDGELVEQSLEEIDSNILRHISAEWKQLHKVAANMMISKWDEGYANEPFYTLIWRLRSLIAENKIERRGQSTGPLYQDDPLKGYVRLVS